MSTVTQSGSTQQQVQDPQLAPGPCKTYSWSPEVHNFYGDAEAILGKMDGIDMALDDRRIYALVVDSGSDREVRFFEQVDATHWAVLSWRGAAEGDLAGQIEQAVLDNHGVHCVGEQVKALLGRNVDLQLEGIVPAPSSGRAAFAHTVRAHGAGQFIRATTAMLC
ncbi:MAG TPA: hypothetical protein VGO80_08870 [Solirubrobacteraceae bacterium]|jgi:hypothetical protein|nr:hypothetical protein [Solirubrobacteraceae bacterium]